MTTREVRVVIRGDDGASAPLGLVTNRIKALRDASENAGRGLGRIGNLLGDISREALGATGPAGRLAEKLLEFGVGGGIFAALTGGIALIVLAYNKMTAATREAEKATDDLIKKLYELSPAGQHDKRVEQLTELNKRIETLQQKLDPSSNPFAFALRGAEEIKALRVELEKAIYDRQRLLVLGGLDLPELTTGESPEEKFAREQREKRAQAGADQAAIDIRNAGGPRVVGGSEPQIRKSGLGGVDPGEMPGVFGQAQDAAMGLGDALAYIGEVTPGIAEAFEAINNSVLASIPGFGIVAKAAQKAVQIVARVEGGIAIAQGAVKIAKSIFPFNPAEFLSGTKMVAEGARLAALGGGSGGSGGGGGGGGGGSNFAQSAQQTQQLQRDSVDVILPPIIPTTDPGVQDWLAQLIRDAAGRNVVFHVGVSN